MSPERGERRGAGDGPWLTLGVVAFASLAAILPGIDGILEYDRAAVGAGEPWRLLTGQLVHWTGRMAVADLVVLFAVGAWLESRSRRLALAALLTGGLLVGLGLHGFAPGLSHYRGSSGLASALFAASALEMAAGSPRRWARVAALAALGLFGMKLLWEMETGCALAAGPLLPGVRVTPQAHVMGGLAGLLSCSFFHRPRGSVRGAGRREGVPAFGSRGPGPIFPGWLAAAAENSLRRFRGIPRCRPGRS